MCVFVVLGGVCFCVLGEGNLWELEFVFFFFWFVGVGTRATQKIIF